MRGRGVLRFVFRRPDCGIDGFFHCGVDRLGCLPGRNSRGSFVETGYVDGLLSGLRGILLVGI